MSSKRKWNFPASGSLSIETRILVERLEALTEAVNKLTEKRTIEERGSTRYIHSDQPLPDPPDYGTCGGE